MNPRVVRFNEAEDTDALTHWGINGMKWGRRRWQNEDGSLTEEGRRHYGIKERREESRAKERLEREKAKAQFKVTRAEADARVKIAKEQAKANADMQSQIAKENAKAQAKVARENAKAARENAKADAKKAKAMGQSQVDIAKQDVKGVTSEAKQETKRAKIAAQVQIQDDRVKAIQNNMFRKLVLGGAAVAGAAVLIKAWKGTPASSSVVSEAASKGESLLKSNEKLRNLCKSQAATIKENTSLIEKMTSVLADSTKLLKGSYQD